MLAPKKLKYRKRMKGRMPGNAQRGSTLAFGDFGLQATDRGWASARPLAGGRRSPLPRHTRRGGRVGTRVFPDKPLTKKPAETRMGKGKGAPEQWVAVIRPGKVLFEMEGVSAETAAQAMRLAAHKLPMRTKLV